MRGKRTIRQNLIFSFGFCCILGLTLAACNNTPAPTNTSVVTSAATVEATQRPPVQARTTSEATRALVLTPRRPTLPATWTPAPTQTIAPTFTPRPTLTPTLTLTATLSGQERAATWQAAMITTTPRAKITESLTIPLNTTKPITTQNRYSGRVTLVIRGTGEMGGSGTDFSDALYHYAKADGTLLTPPLNDEYTLGIDDKPVLEALGLTEAIPPLSPNHVYVVTYFVGGPVREITFRTRDPFPADNIGEYHIDIYAPAWSTDFH